MTKLRIQVEGSIKTKIWEDMDLGGFVEMAGKKRTIGFSNTERYYAKGTHGVSGVYDIPTLYENANNNFIANLFSSYINDLNSFSTDYIEKQSAYEKAMSFIKIIDKCGEAEHLNNALEKLKLVNHSLTSERELKTHLINKAKELGYKYDTNKKAFI